MSTLVTGGGGLVGLHVSERGQGDFLAWLQSFEVAARA